MTLSPAFELVAPGRADSGVDGEVDLQNSHGLPDLERAHGAQRGGIRACGVIRSILAGGSHFVLENTSNGTLVYIVDGSCGHLDRTYKLPQRLPQKVHWAWCITGGGAGGE